MSRRGNIKKNLSESPETVRKNVIVKTSTVSIVTNIFLALFKAVIGIVSNSIAVTLDAVNNLSDALSSIITIVGTKLAGKLPDKKHPFGYGRIEYLSAMVVSGIVLYAGFTAMVESVKKILSPATPDYSTASLIIISMAIVVKLILGKYVTEQGKKANSGSLLASGTEALFDAILSFSVLLSAIIFLISNVSLEAYVGVIISVMIIKSGTGLMIETLNEILGIRADKKVTDQVKQVLISESVVRGAYDLILYNYGPDTNYASVHLELPEYMTAKEIDQLTRKLEAKVYKNTGVVLSAVGVYAYNTGDDAASKIQNDVRHKVLSHDWALQIHGFYVDIENKELRFDVVLNFDITPEEGMGVLYEEMKDLYPDYKVLIVPDVDVSVS